MDKTISVPTSPKELEDIIVPPRVRSLPLHLSELCLPLPPLPLLVHCLLPYLMLPLVSPRQGKRKDISLTPTTFVKWTGRNTSGALSFEKKQTISAPV